MKKIILSVAILLGLGACTVTTYEPYSTYSRPVYSYPGPYSGFQYNRNYDRRYYTRYERDRYYRNNRCWNGSWYRC